MPHRGPPYTYEERPWQEPHWQRRAVGIVVWLSAMAVIAALMTIAIGVITQEAEPFEPLAGPLYADVPVPVSDGTVAPGGTVAVTVNRCIDGDDPVLLFTTTRWESLGTQPPVTVPGQSSFTLAKPGCQAQEVAVPVPPGMPAGRWEMEAIDGAIANTGPGIQVRTWRTKPVEVVP